MQVDIRKCAEVLYKKRQKKAKFYQLPVQAPPPQGSAGTISVFRGNRLIFRDVRSIGLATMVALLSACTTGTQYKAGDRPFVYPQGPGDPPAVIHNDAGVISRRDAPVSEPVIPSAPGAQPNANSGVMTAVQRPSWAPAQTPTPAAQVAQAGAPVAAAPMAGPAVETQTPPVPTGYTQATRYGDMLFLSGQIPLDPRTGAMTADATIEGQTRQVMDNIRAVIESNRLTMANVLSVTVFVTNVNTLPQVDRIYQSYFKTTVPARSVVQVAGLPRGALIEISAVAGR